MKKVFAAILAFIYLSASMGATVHLHYCMNKLVAWSFVKEKINRKSCSYCGMAKTTPDNHCRKQTKGCCKDEQKQIKIAKDHKAVNASFNFVKPLLQITDNSSFASSSFIVPSPTLEYPNTHAPPRAGNISLFLRNGVFRI